MTLEESTKKPKTNKTILLLLFAASLISTFISPIAYKEGCATEDLIKITIAQGLFYGGFLGFLLTIYPLSTQRVIEQKELMELMIVGLAVIYLINAGMIAFGIQQLFF